MKTRISKFLIKMAVKFIACADHLDPKGAKARRVAEAIREQEAYEAGARNALS